MRDLRYAICDTRCAMEERLQKILARAGFGARRVCEDLIRQGRVTVNGEVARLGQKADPRRDRIEVDGRPVRLPREFTYIALHKPPGVLSDEGDGTGRRPTVLDLVEHPARLFPVGRLDLRSEGLVLLTDDGDLALRLTHPRFGHEKEYHVLVEGCPPEETLEEWRRGWNWTANPPRRPGSPSCGGRRRGRRSGHGCGWSCGRDGSGRFGGRRPSWATPSSA